MEPVIDHLCWLVEDGEEFSNSLRRDHGFGSVQGMYYSRAGTQHWNVPLAPPAYLEFMAIVNRHDAEHRDVGPESLAAEARGHGLFSWSVLVDDLETVSERLGLEIDDYTLEQPDGTLRGWRTVSGPSHLPFFIDYPNNPGRPTRLREMYERVEHDHAPSTITMLFIEGDADEMGEWLGQNSIPITFREGNWGIYGAEIATQRGPKLLPPLIGLWQLPGGGRLRARPILRSWRSAATCLRGAPVRASRENADTAERRMADNCYSESRRPCLEPSVDTRALIGGGAVSGMSGHKEPSHANWQNRSVLDRKIPKPAGATGRFGRSGSGDPAAESDSMLLRLSATRPMSPRHRGPGRTPPRLSERPNSR